MRRTRRRLGLSQDDAAKRCGLTKQQLQRVEAAGANVTFVTLARIAEGLGVDAGRLLAPITVPERLRDPERRGRDDRVP